MRQKYVIAGSGATGGSIGAFLAQAGQDVTFLARGAQLAAFREKGITMKGTAKGDFRVFPIKAMTMEEYISLLIRCIEQLPPQLVIHRLTGDGPKDLLIAPLWSTRKRTVLNQIHAEFRRRGTWQGKYYLPPTEGGKPGGNLCRNHLHSTN